VYIGKIILLPPMKNVEWEKVLEHFKDELPDDTAFLQDYVGGLP